jgi:hypothetical protein
MTRRLILSDWYQGLWGRRFRLTEDQNTKLRFDTDAGGSRIATSVGGSLLGIGGDIVVCDDLHNTSGIESEADRETVLQFFQEISSTRLNNPREAAVIVVAQRLHEEDVPGWIYSNAKEGEWEYLMCPMRFDSRRILSFWRASTAQQQSRPWPKLPAKEKTSPCESPPPWRCSIELMAAQHSQSKWI